MFGLRLLAVVALVVINSFFAAAEFSLVAVRLSRVRQLVEQGDARARIVQELLGQLDRVVSGVQVGITLTSLGLGALGEMTLAQLFLPLVSWLPGQRGPILAHGIALSLAFLLLTAMHVVLGELVPKTMSLERAERVSLLIARPFHWYLATFRWAIDLLDGISQVVVRSLGVRPRAAGHMLPHSAEELQVQIRQAREHGLLAPGQERFILSAMDLGQLRVSEIMVSRPDVHALPVEAGLDDALALFATTQRSRLPVYTASLDHVLGFVHIKDVVWLLLDRQRRLEEGVPVPQFDLRRLLREVLIVPESKLASELLAEMRTRRITLAMVVDEFGSILGLLTLEDLLEQLVGEIHDEFDVVEAPLVVGTGAEAAMIFDGATGLHDLQTQYNIELPEDPAYATLGGFVMAQLGFIPRGGEGFDYGGYRFTVLEMEHRRVARVKLQRLSPATESASSQPSESSPPSGAASSAASGVASASLPATHGSHTGEDRSVSSAKAAGVKHE
jgi:CBS domain containing-hemolysin-like protein